VDLRDWFELDTDSPYMLLVADLVQEKRRTMSAAENALFGVDNLSVVRSVIPAVTHVDFSARVQTVHQDTNSRYHKLLGRFQDLTNCPILVDTSFNVRVEPIVSTPEDAFRCFMGTEPDVLVVGNAFLIKDKQVQARLPEYANASALDWRIHDMATVRKMAMEWA
jgi:carbamoyltransferase